MSKHLRKIGLGLALGGLVGHYLTTAKGQAFKKRLGQEWQTYQEDPEAYLAQVKDQLQAYVATVKEEVARETDPMIIDGEFEESNQVTQDDIIITFDDENQF